MLLAGDMEPVSPTNKAPEVFKGTALQEAVPFRVRYANIRRIHKEKPPAARKGIALFLFAFSGLQRPFWRVCLPASALPPIGTSKPCHMMHGRQSRYPHPGKRLCGPEGLLCVVFGVKYRGNRKNENRGIGGFPARSESVHMCRNRSHSNRKEQKNGTTNRRPANSYAKANANRRTGIIRHCTGTLLFFGVGISSTAPLTVAPARVSRPTRHPRLRQGWPASQGQPRPAHCKGPFVESFLTPAFALHCKIKPVAFPRYSILKVRVWFFILGWFARFII